MEMDPLKIYLLFKMGIFHCCVSLPEGNIFEMGWFNHYLEEGHPDTTKARKTSTSTEEISLSPKNNPGRGNPVWSPWVFLTEKFSLLQNPIGKKRVGFNQKSGMNDPFFFVTSLF